MGDVKVLRGKILFWTERSDRPKRRFFRCKPAGLDLDSDRGAGYLCCPFFFLGNDKKEELFSHYSTEGAEAMRGDRHSWLEQKRAASVCDSTLMLTAAALCAAFKCSDVNARDGEFSEGAAEGNFLCRTVERESGQSPVIDKAKPYRGDGVWDLKEGTKRQRSGVLEVTDGGDPAESGGPQGQSEGVEDGNAEGGLSAVIDATTHEHCRH